MPSPLAFRLRNPHDPNPSSSPCLTSERGESGGQIPSNQRCVWISYWLRKGLAVTLHASQRDECIPNLTEGWGHTFCSSFTIASSKQAQVFTERVHKREEETAKKEKRGWTGWNIVWNVVALHLKQYQTERHQPRCLQQTPLEIKPSPEAVHSSHRSIRSKITSEALRAGSNNEKLKAFTVISPWVRPTGLHISVKWKAPAFPDVQEALNLIP